ncbi:hypothetical protein FH608_015295 [Nonomuraea phyllanthi]|uniref:Uncharacterized protein n=1 Tax=Nonomuraea phyllanthi TaxID=2219224 RepID=A0A5C4WKR5_9ACTN|nr:hypothetical protein [Nonomuraea phyllanthi]KAB8194566.1 hypothetical protein FH608_015295 [Nonomuraea phyllanthi]
MTAGHYPLRPQCTTAAIGLRQLTIRSNAQHEAVERARHRQLTYTWWDRFKIRASVEGTTRLDLDLRRDPHDRAEGPGILEFIG